MFPNSRRQWLKKSGIITTGLLLAGGIHSCTREKTPHILLVSGWQDVNIGDIAHTPGLLHVLETHLPQASITLWKRSKSDKVEELLKKNFPKVNIIYGDVDQDKNVQDAEIKAAFEKADVMIHGSGPSVVGQSNLEAWVKATDKPFGLETEKFFMGKPIPKKGRI